jgi:hypothetical protein
MTTKALAYIAALALPFAASAHADDAAYCRALVEKYQAFLIKTGGHSPNPGIADGSVAVEQCRAGNPAGIPVLERKLRDARIDLPTRGQH